MKLDATTAMIDLHSHILPGIDDGAPDMSTAFDMARMAVDDGIAVMACTPHMLPGVYDADAVEVRRRVAHLNERLIENDIDLSLVVGSDAHIRPDFVTALRDGRILTLNDSRYVLVEPPHSVMPRRLDDLFFEILMAGYVPILTHPERLTWLASNIKVIEGMVRSGVWLQITAGSLCGDFGRNAKYWAQWLLAQGLVHIIATDAHNVGSRPPRLAQARRLAEAEVGASEATKLFVMRAQQIVDDIPSARTIPIGITKTSAPEPIPLWRRLTGGASA
jgi:protein-tyrosine phosphatase